MRQIINKVLDVIYLNGSGWLLNGGIEGEKGKVLNCL